MHADSAWLNFSQASLLWTSDFPQAWASAKIQTFLSPLTAHSENQLTIREKQFLLNCSIMLSAHPSPPLAPSHTHTHTQSSCWPYSSFHVKETSFSVLFWDMPGSVLKTFSLLQSVPFNGSVISDSLRPYCLQHIRLHCPSPTPRACLKFKPIKLVMPSNHLILCRPLLLWPSIFPCIWVFSNESVLCLRWPKYWSFSISPSNEYSGLISSRIDCIDFLAVQGTLGSLPQHHSSKESVLQCSAFFMVQLSHAYMTVGKT